jgi:hypothetical protein
MRAHRDETADDGRTPHVRGLGALVSRALAASRKCERCGATSGHLALVGERRGARMVHELRCASCLRPPVAPAPARPPDARHTRLEVGERWLRKGGR